MKLHLITGCAEALSNSFNFIYYNAVVKSDDTAVRKHKMGAYKGGLSFLAYKLLCRAAQKPLVHYLYALIHCLKRISSVA